jgi:microcystin degradation protein MlrC
MCEGQGKQDGTAVRRSIEHGLATADIPDQRDRVAVVTGANGGLGLEVARELARKGRTS